MAQRSKYQWEGVFETWAKGPAATEQEKADRAETAVRKAIAASATLNALDISVFAQGSYCNRTNVREESDVDICVRLNSTFHYELPTGLTLAEAGISPSPYTYPQFKNEVGTALVDHFGQAAVSRGRKAFDVHANTYRVDADVVPTFEFREYFRTTDSLDYRPGVQLIPDGGAAPIRNYPEQQYTQGVEKNDRTNRRFKRTVRILKRLRNEIATEGDAAAKAMPSYLLECLVANVSEDAFEQDTHYATVRWVLADVCSATHSDSACGEWFEVNGIKYLFRPTQPWNRAAVNVFGNTAWRVLGFEDE